MHGNTKIVVIYIIHSTPHLNPAKMKWLDLTVLFYTLTMQLSLWPSLLLYCLAPSFVSVDEKVNAQMRSKLNYGFDKLRMINSYLTISVYSKLTRLVVNTTYGRYMGKTRNMREGKTHDNMVTALLGTVLTKLIDNPL